MSIQSKPDVKHIYTKYLRDDGTLDYQSVYFDMWNIVGFRAKHRRERLYNDVLDWYGSLDGKATED